MAGSLGSVRAFGFLAILAAVMLLFFSGVAQANNPCYGQCFFRCVNTPVTCQFSPSCVKGCEKTCSSQDTCKQSSHSLLLPNSAKPEDVAKSHVGGKTRKTLPLNFIADE